jgi:hypothetical protein
MADLTVFFVRKNTAEWLAGLADNLKRTGLGQAGSDLTRCSLALQTTTRRQEGQAG